MKERICKNCVFWRWNGGPLGIGYCTANCWTYRKPEQRCADFEPFFTYTFTVEIDGDTDDLAVRAASREEAETWFREAYPGVDYDISEEGKQMKD